ncbi:MAG: hypothetical protein GXY65_11415 [Rhodococcus sp.]|nr:hypothetical protein [Rhodococcus sp. (in: high G+C Gram-positive bacteria)]
MIAAFGRTATDLAGHVDVAAATTRNADPAALAPILGAVGADFLAVFTEAHRRHVADLTRIGDTLSAMGSVAVLTAAAYDRSVDEFAAGVRAAGSDT